jgi:hypothetical protein
LSSADLFAYPGRITLDEPLETAILLGGCLSSADLAVSTSCPVIEPGGKRKMIFSLYMLLVMVLPALPQAYQTPPNDYKISLLIARPVAQEPLTPRHFSLDIGKKALRVGDTVVSINWAKILLAKGEIASVNETISEGKFTGIWTRNFREVAATEAYIVNRSNSPCSLP